MNNSALQLFSAFVDGDQIIYQDYMGNRQAVGVINRAVEALKAENAKLNEKVKEYYDWLVDLEAITPDPTPEDIIRQQAEQLKANSEIMQDLAAELKALKAELKALKEERHVRPEKHFEQNFGAKPGNDRGGQKGLERGPNLPAGPNRS